MTGVITKRGNIKADRQTDTQTHTHKETPRKDGGRDLRMLCAAKKPGDGQHIARVEQIIPHSLCGPNSADTPTLNLQPPELGDNPCLWLKQLSTWYFVTAALENNTPTQVPPLSSGVPPW